MNIKGLAATTVVSVLLILFSYHFIDARLTFFAARLLITLKLPHAAANIPDLLFAIVVITTILSWAGFLFFGQRSARGFSRSLFLSLGLSVPLAFTLKLYLKYVFGRPLPSVWLYRPGSFGFHWFYSGPTFGAFPSGHMAVFTAIMLCIGRYYPRFKNVTSGFLVVLGLALVFTNRHFLSDVIAGFLVGVLSESMTDTIVRGWISYAKNRNDME